MIPSFSMFSRPNQKTFIPFFPTYFLESYILHIRIIPCPFTSSVLGHPIHPSFSLPLEKARANEWMCTKNRGWRKRKKGAKKEAGEEETPGWINGRNIKKEGEENGRKRSIMRKSGGRREISFAREPFDASNQRHHVRILIIEAFICANKHRSPDAAKWATYLFVPPE